MRSLPADGGTSSRQSPLRETKMGPKAHSSAATMNEIRGRSQHNHLNEIEFLNTTRNGKLPRSSIKRDGFLELVSFFIAALSCACGALTILKTATAVSVRSAC